MPSVVPLLVLHLSTYTPHPGATPEWPPNRGFLGPPVRVSLCPGTIVDRYGAPTGTFVSPQGTPFAARALPQHAALSPLHTYEVIRPIEVHAGPAAPWFDLPGMDVQYELPAPVQCLIDSGHLRSLCAADSPLRAALRPRRRPSGRHAAVMRRQAVRRSDRLHVQRSLRGGLQRSNRERDDLVDGFLEGFAQGGGGAGRSVVRRAIRALHGDGALGACDTLVV